MPLTKNWTVLLAGPEGPFHKAIVERLTAETYTVLSAPVTHETTVSGIVITATLPTGGTLDSLEIPAFIDGLDKSLCYAMASVRDLCLAGGLRRIVLLASLDARGASQVTAPAAISGAFTGLARSWALELGTHGTTANAVLASIHDASADVLPGVAEAIALFMSPNSGAISGQVLCVSPDTNAGIIPL